MAAPDPRGHPVGGDEQVTGVCGAVTEPYRDRVGGGAVRGDRGGEADRVGQPVQQDLPQRQPVHRNVPVVVGRLHHRQPAQLVVVDRRPPRRLVGDRPKQRVQLRRQSRAQRPVTVPVDVDAVALPAGQQRHVPLVHNNLDPAAV